MRPQHRGEAGAAGRQEKTVYSHCEIANFMPYIVGHFTCTVCPGSSAPPEKIFNIFASENEVYPIY